MRLYVEPMDAVVVEIDGSGRVRYLEEPGRPASDWSMPTLQERRAIIYAARQELAALSEVLEVLEGTSGRPH